MAGSYLAGRSPVKVSQGGQPSCCLRCAVGLFRCGYHATWTIFGNGPQGVAGRGLGYLAATIMASALTEYRTCFKGLQARQTAEDRHAQHFEPDSPYAR